MPPSRLFWVVPIQTMNFMNAPKTSERPSSQKIKLVVKLVVKISISQAIRLYIR